MAAQHVEPKEEKSTQRISPVPVGETSTTQRYPAAEGAGHTDLRTAFSGNPQLPRTQQHTLLTRVGRARGNRHVQRLVSSFHQGQVQDHVQRDLEDEAPSDPAQLVNLLGMRCEEGSFGAWFAGHWRTLLGYNPRRVYMGGMGAWTQGASAQTEYTFRPNQQQQRIPRDWYEEMRRLYRTGARITTSQITLFWWNRNSLQETVNYWAPLFDPRIRSAAGEFASTAMRSEEYRRFLSIMRLHPPEITVPAQMRDAPEYSPR